MDAVGTSSFPFAAFVAPPCISWNNDTVSLTWATRGTAASSRLLRASSFLRTFLSAYYLILNRPCCAQFHGRCPQSLLPFPSQASVDETYGRRDPRRAAVADHPSRARLQPLLASYEAYLHGLYSPGVARTWQRSFTGIQMHS